jgi:hypothetical protein
VFESVSGRITEASVPSCTPRETMTAAQVKARLTTAGFGLERLKSPAAITHHTMARMAMAGELEVDRNGSDRTSTQVQSAQ